MLEIKNVDTRPPVTILLPIFNEISNLPSLRVNIEACARIQDEILIVDDQSSDDSPRFLSQWAREDFRVAYVRNPQKGLAGGLNLGLHLASHAWIARFDADDLCEPNRIDSQIDLVANDVGAVFSDYDNFSVSPRKFARVPSPVNDSATAISLVTNRRTPHSSALLNKDACIGVGGYIADHFPAEDLSLWLRLAKVSKLLTVPEALLHYRISANSVTSHRRSEMLAMRRELIGTIGLTVSKIENANQEWRSIIDSYGKLDLSKERILLFLNDLRTVNEVASIPREHRALMHTVPLVIKELDSYAAASAKLVYKSMTRKFSRKFTV
jgi:glycosyltransferase involved in cell wall biosynthesis